SGGFQAAAAASAPHEPGEIPQQEPWLRGKKSVTPRDNFLTMPNPVAIVGPPRGQLRKRGIRAVQAFCIPPPGRRQSLAVQQDSPRLPCGCRSLRRRPDAAERAEKARSRPGRGAGG